MATTFSVTLVRPSDGVERHQLQVDIERLLSDIEAIASTYDPSSEISRFNRQQTTQWQPVSMQFCTMMRAAHEISSATEGSFDPTIGRAVETWGFGTTQSAASIPSIDITQRIGEDVGFEKLQVDCDRPAIRKSVERLSLDLSAWAKGHAVDAVANYLDGKGLTDYMVEIGGEVRAAGKNPSGDCFRIGIESPRREERTLAISLPLCDAAVATSGSYRNFFVADGKTYSHTINPKTARPVDHTLASVTVVHDSAATADALATALLVLGPTDGPALASEQQIAALFVISSGDSVRTESSPAFESLR